MNTKTIKTGVLAGVAALALTVPAAAFAQPFYGHDGGYSRQGDFRRDDYRRDDFRRFEREREFRRAEELRRLRWEREHARYGYGGYGYR